MNGKRVFKVIHIKFTLFDIKKWSQFIQHHERETAHTKERTSSTMQ